MTVPFAAEHMAAEIARLRADLKKANEQAEHFEREWYLRGDEIESLTAKLGEQANVREPTTVAGIRHTDPFDSARIGDYNNGWNDRHMAAILQLSDERIFEIAEPFGEFRYGDAQGDKRLAFARAVIATLTAAPKADVQEPVSDEHGFNEFWVDNEFSPYLYSSMNAAFQAGAAWQRTQAQIAPAGFVMVPVDLVKQAALHLSDWLELDQCECEGPHYCGRTQVSATNRQLRAIAAATSAPAAPEVSDE